MDRVARYESVHQSIQMKRFQVVKTTKLNQDRRTWGVADRLYRALGSTRANIAESYLQMSRKRRHGSLNTRLVRPAKAAIGISKAGISLVKRPFNTGWTLSPVSFSYSS
jgi:hypothetical protein